MDELQRAREPELRATLFQAAPHGYLVLDLGLTIIDVNDRYLAMTRTSKTDLIGRPLFEAFPDDPTDSAADGTRNLRKSLDIVLKTKKPHRMAVQKYDIPVRKSASSDFEERYWQPLNTPVVNGGELVAIIHHVEDVTTEFLGQRNQAIQLRLATQISGIGYGELDLQTKTANVSRELAELFGFTNVEGTTDSYKFFERIHPDDLAIVEEGLAQAVQQQVDTAIDIIYRIVLLEEEIRWINTRGEVHFEQGVAARFVGVSLDLTEVKRNEQQLQDIINERDMLLEQKEILLNDVNHRVKNSLQLVVSILRIEARSTLDLSVRASLQQASRRVHAVSSVHELIYKSQNVTQVDIGDYIPQLVDYLSSSVASPEQSIQTVARSDSLVLPTDTAISVALLVNELVTNAHKHAFVGREQGLVEVVVTSEANYFVVVVKDNGIGRIDSDASRGLGSRIVDGIVSQLKAKLEAKADDGYCVFITIPL